MADDRFEDDFRRRIRTEGDEVRLTLTPEQLQRRAVVRRRERRERVGWLGAAAAFLVVAVLAIGPGGLLGPATTGPTPAPTVAPTVGPAPESFGPSFSVVPSQPLESPPGIEGQALIELARFDLTAATSPRTVTTPLPGGTDFWRVAATCDGPGSIVVHAVVALRINCSTGGGPVAYEFPADPARLADASFELDVRLTAATFAIVAFDRDVPVGAAPGFAPPRLVVSSPANPAVEVNGSCGLVVGADEPDGPCPRIVPVIPDAGRVSVVARDPLTVVMPGAAIDAIAIEIWDTATLLADPFAVPGTLDILSRSGAEWQLNTPAPGDWTLRLVVSATASGGPAFSVPFFIRLDSQGRG